MIFKMKFASFEVKIEPEQEIYYSGQTVYGNVTATVQEPFNCRNVKIFCKGKTKVEWSTDKSYFCKNERYFMMEETVWTGGDEVEIPQGDYVWPFQFILPPNIPPSFDGCKGWIRYKIQAVADIPKSFDDKIEHFFSVNVIDDLNSNELALKPLTLKKIDKTCYGCCARGPVQLNLHCRRSGAVVGENFKIRGEISNEGSKTVKETAIVLEQKIKYSVDGVYTKERHDVSSIKRGAIAPGQSEFFDDVPLKVEAVVTKLKNCKIIDIDYRIKVIASFGTCAKVKGYADIIIGTVPFKLEGYQDGASTNMGMKDSGDESIQLNLMNPSTPAIMALVPTTQSTLGQNAAGTSVQATDTPYSPNPFGMKGPATIEPAYFCVSGRSRLSSKSPAPKYLSFVGVLD